MSRFVDLECELYRNRNEFRYDLWEGEDAYKNDWVVLPDLCRRSGYGMDDRDSILYDSNHDTVLKMLDEDAYFIGNGAIVVDPKRHLDVIMDLFQSFENYPILDEDDFSQREWNTFVKDWNAWLKSDVQREFVTQMVNEYEECGIVDPTDGEQIIIPFDRDEVEVFFETICDLDGFDHILWDLVSCNASSAEDVRIRNIDFNEIELNETIIMDGIQEYMMEKLRTVIRNFKLEEKMREWYSRIPETETGKILEKILS